MDIVSLADLKAHLNITPEELQDDSLITSYGEAAQEWIELFTGADFTTVDIIHAPLKQAARMLVAHWFENREAVAMGVTSDMVPLGVFDLLKPYRQWTF